MRALPTSLWSTLTLALLVAVWIVLAPTRFGGQAAYVLVVGNSMEPRLHRGDLVVIREQPQYDIGDVVTYRHPQIGPVIHRIIERQGERFVFKGDNNSWIDSYQPAQSELLGKLWFDVPRAGALLEQLRNPWVFGIFAALVAMMVTGSAVGTKHARQSLGTARTTNPRASGPLLVGGGAISALAGVAFLCTLLVVYAFAQPLQRTAPNDISYEHAGAFSYGAEVPSGAAFDSNVVTTGEPVFRRLASEVTVQYAYRLTSERPRDLAGTTTLHAVVSDASGWRRTLALQAATDFRGDTAVAVGTLDLTRVQTIIDALQVEAGVQRAEFGLAVVADVAVSGTVGGRELRDQHTARLPFRLDTLQLQLAPTAREPEPLRASQPGTIRGFRVEPNSLALLSLRLDVAAVRVTGLACLAIALLAITAVGLGQVRTRHDPEADRIQATYGAALLAVKVNPLPAAGRMVEVSAFADLGRLAERTGRVILHSTTGGAHTYLLQDGEVSYVYQIPADDGALA